jgi:hypothetical protein
MKISTLQALQAALIRMLRPLVRILLRNGMSFRTFSDLVKKLFVDVALEEFGLEGRKQSISRVSVLTGLSRKEVKRVLELPEPLDNESAEQYNRAARVIAGWRRDKDFLDRKGNPTDLKIQGKGTTFSALVKRYSGDLPVRAILDELSRVNAVSLLKNGRVRLRARSYIPQSDETIKIHILGTDAGYLISTIDHNLTNSETEPFFQRKVSYNNLPSEVLPKFRNLSSQAAQKLLERLDSWLAKHDRDTEPAGEGTGRNVAGIGIYYFEEPFNE